MSIENALLPREAVAFVQHIELNKAGWWNKTVQRLVLAAVWLADSPPSAEAILESLSTTFKLRLNTAKLTAALEFLESNKVLLRLPSETYRIPDEQRKHFEETIGASERAEASARDSFTKLVADLTTELVPEEVWDAFESEFLSPLIKQVGANAYRLVAGERMTADRELVDRFLRPFPAGTHARLRDLVTAFLDPKKPEVCAYVSRMLHARFCVEASGLPEEVLQKLNASVGKQIRFRMFVDTNFLFSLLELHENPSNAAAQELRELVLQLKGNPSINLVITPKTIEEAKASIAYTKSQLSGLPAGRNFTEAAIQARFSGMVMRFLSERLRRNGKLTTDEWFDPYLNDFVPIARSRGIELHNEKMDDYATRQDVVDDIHVVLKFEEKLPEARRKTYPKIAHDMILWHFVSDKRSAYIESPIDANDWILTVDFRLIGFDEHKQKRSTAKVPLCIHPTSLIQLLQFWVPRTKEFEEAMLGSLRLPFLFQDFDAEAEKTSLRILKGIGRFEGGEDLPQETITHLMLNDDLRSRLQTEHADEAEVTLIRDALVEEMRQRAESEANKVKALEESVLKRESEVAILAAEKAAAEIGYAQTKKLKEDAEESIRQALAAHNAELDKLRAKVSAMEDAERARMDADARRKATGRESRVLIVYLGLLLVICLFSFLTAWWLPSRFIQLTSLIGFWWTCSLLAVAFFILSHFALERTMGRKQPMCALWPFQQISRFRRWLWSLVILGFVLGVIGNLVANHIQQNLDRQSTSTSSPAGTAGK